MDQGKSRDIEGMMFWKSLNAVIQLILVFFVTPLPPRNQIEFPQHVSPE